jgi:hypothetical protein
MRTALLVAVMMGVGLSCVAQTVASKDTLVMTSPLTINPTSGTEAYVSSCGIIDLSRADAPDPVERLKDDYAHREKLLDLLAIPFTVIYCTTIVCLSIFLIAWTDIRTLERRNCENNRSLEEIARIEAAAGHKPEEPAE